MLKIRSHTRPYYIILWETALSKQWLADQLSDQTFLEISLSPWVLIQYLTYIWHFLRANITRGLDGFWPCSMHSHDLDLRDSKADFFRYPRADLSWHILLVSQDFLGDNTGIRLAHGLSVSFLSNIMPVHKGADWHIQVKRDQGPKPVPSVQDDFWNTQCLGLRAKTPCNACIQGLFVKQNWIPPHRGLMMPSHVPKISAFCPWNLWSY